MEAVGAQYVSTAEAPLAELGRFDLVVEAAGSAELMAESLGLLRRSGIACLLGIDGRAGTVELERRVLGLDTILENRVLFGSVNARLEDWLAAVDALEQVRRRWPDALEATVRVRAPLDRFAEALAVRGGKATLVVDEAASGAANRLRSCGQRPNVAAAGRILNEKVRELVFGSRSGEGRWKLVVMLLALVFALATVAAACGGDDDEGGTGDTGAAATGDGGGEGSIWVLLPDSATSPRWETDDRRYFEQAFEEAGVRVQHRQRRGRRLAAAGTGRAGHRRRRQRDRARQHRHRLRARRSSTTAKDAGVDVVEYDRFNTGGSGGAAYVSFDNVQVGATMAEVLEPAIDALGVDKPRVVMLNGGEEDNNSFLFRAGYAETVEARAEAGDWAIVADQHVPGWDNQRRGPDDHGADPGRREQRGRRGVRRQRRPRPTRRSTRSRPRASDPCR